ncbi:MAG: serine/threonine-protein kinase, partial [Stackebrandtia sp.]
MQPNQLLGERYRLIERIGAGGMGEVWRAEDLMLERVVAVKALHPAMADNADVRQRFLREARTVAALSAPGVVAMYDTAEETAPDGSVLSYLVMEFVVGRPLSEHVDSGDRLPPETDMLLMAQVAQGLDAAHRVGIFHRDVKPTNILVNRSGDATLVDFGIARRAGDTALTTSGAVMGTVEYASPEQLRGEELTPASDVYSLGIVAYECLTGRRPFEGQSVATVIAGHLNRTPPALGQEVAAPIARVVMRALAKDPGDRFDSAAELNRACHDAVRTAASPAANTRMLHEAAVAPPTRQQPIVPPETDEAPPRHRSRWPVLIGTAVALVLVAAIGVIFFTLDLSADSVGDGPSDDPGKSSASDKPEVTK